MRALLCHLDTCANQPEPLSTGGGKAFSRVAPRLPPITLTLARAMQLSLLLFSLALFHTAAVASPIAGRAENSTGYGGISWGAFPLSPTPPPPSPVSVLIVSPSGSPFPVSGLDGFMLEYCRPLPLVRLLPARSWSQGIGELTSLNSLSLFFRQKWAADGPVNITITRDPVCPGGYRSCPVVRPPFVQGSSSDGVTIEETR